MIAEMTAGLVTLGPVSRSPKTARGAARQTEQIGIQKARDASILSGGDIEGYRGPGRTAIRVQSTALSHSLIYRAGVRYQRRFAYYIVVATKDNLNRWQLADRQESEVVK